MSPFYLWQVGRLMLESHVSLRDDSEATTSEVDALEEWRLGAEIATSPIS
jgi:galactokinase